MNPTLGSEHPAHLYWMMMPTDDDQSGLIRHLRERDIIAAFHYQALDESVAGRRLAFAPATLRGVPPGLAPARSASRSTQACPTATSIAWSRA